MREPRGGVHGDVVGAIVQPGDGYGFHAQFSGKQRRNSTRQWRSRLRSAHGAADVQSGRDLVSLRGHHLQRSYRRAAAHRRLHRLPARCQRRDHRSARGRGSIVDDDGPAPGSGGGGALDAWLLAMLGLCVFSAMVLRIRESTSGRRVSATPLPAARSLSGRAFWVDAPTHPRKLPLRGPGILH